MVETDFDEFVQALDDFAGLRQLPPLDARAKALFFRAVARYPLAQVLRGIEAHLIDPAEGKFKTMVQPAHIVAQIEAAAGQDGRPTADEAWAIALASRDEADTVIWTQEIAQALTACQPVLDARDEVGARMAFRAAYDRLVISARRAGVPVAWSASLGWDLDRRGVAVTQAVERGQLSAPAAAALLPPPEPVDESADIDVQGNLQRLRQMLASALSPADRRQMAAEAKTQAERRDLSQMKSMSAESVQSYLAGADRNESKSEDLKA